MKALVWHGKNNLTLEEKPMPEIADDEVLLKVAYTGICGSDLHIIEGKLPKNLYLTPQVLGHEFSGVVSKVGKNVTEFRPGDEVTGAPLAGCGGCYFCKCGQEHFCLNPFNVLSEPRSGAYAEYMVLKAKQVYKLPKHLSLKHAALVEPVSIAVHAMDLTNTKTGDSVAVLGGGAIGLACLQVALHAGAGLLILSNRGEFRREIAKKIGADIAVDPTKQNLREVVMEATGGLGVDTCVEAVGVKETLEVAISLTKKTGTVLLVGIPPQEMKLEVSPFEIFSRELRVQGTNWSPYSFIRTIGLMNKLEIDRMITHVFPLSDYEKAFEVQKNRAGIKILLTP